MMYTGSAPFVKADLSDPYFNLIARGDMNKFWKAHMQGRPESFFSAEFKDLMGQMLAYQPFQRPSAADIVFHPFFNDNLIASKSQVRVEMQLREAH